MFNEKPKTKSAMISIRLRDSDAELLQRVADHLQLAGGKAEAVRVALDYWLTNEPNAKRAARREQQ